MKQNPHNLARIKHLCKARFRLYAWRYIAFARLRGFTTFNDWPYHRRSFIACWVEPGFHKFWRIWNPGIAYFVYRLYLKLGGSRNWLIATLLAFEINGLIHSAIFYLLSGQWSFVIPVLFFLFAVCTIISKKLENLLNQNRWPWFVNAVVNIGLVIFLFDTSFKINRILWVYFRLGT